MFVAKVIGNMICTHKNDNLRGLKLMVVQPVDDQLEDKGKPLVAIDTIGQSGVGDLVYLAKSKESSIPLGKDLVPSDAGIMGNIEYYNVEKRTEE
ncbi:ethanolamine utilization protein EutN [Bacillus salipaludis]|uniref:Ethanolamine utilization protein EutN n=1 Tax=Bacillus salipaludis TaxID=2547811 RepID=A0A4R5VQP8_9BACI|nr:EutN/CcmL family microcompartment protein [Bacillus salipaludis]MDQ6598526.1 EutN/CcmL family microcompartment protein [Bacillus salipaludis]TDK60917.1 ethanolamine utilization protein EutN [Bacillus salipaludis]